MSCSKSRRKAGKSVTAAMNSSNKKAEAIAKKEIIWKKWGHNMAPKKKSLPPSEIKRRAKSYANLEDKEHKLTVSIRNREKAGRSVPKSDYERLKNLRKRANETDKKLRSTYDFDTVYRIKNGGKR